MKELTEDQHQAFQEGIKSARENPPTIPLEYLTRPDLYAEWQNGFDITRGNIAEEEENDYAF